jgi:hypothetical protein
MVTKRYPEDKGKPDASKVITGVNTKTNEVAPNFTGKPTTVTNLLKKDTVPDTSDFVPNM